MGEWVRLLAPNVYGGSHSPCIQILLCTKHKAVKLKCACIYLFTILFNPSIHSFPHSPYSPIFNVYVTFLWYKYGGEGSTRGVHVSSATSLNVFIPMKFHFSFLPSTSHPTFVPKVILLLGRVCLSLRALLP